jgi:hypothetical protein
MQGLVVAMVMLVADIFILDTICYENRVFMVVLPPGSNDNRIGAFLKNISFLRKALRRPRFYVIKDTFKIFLGIFQGCYDFARP